MAMDRDQGQGLEGAASMYVSSMMEGQGDREVVCLGRVLLLMSETAWVDRCQVMVRQPTLGKFGCIFESVSWLLSEGLCRHQKEPHGDAVQAHGQGWHPQASGGGKESGHEHEGRRRGG